MVSVPNAGLLRDRAQRFGRGRNPALAPRSFAAGAARQPPQRLKCGRPWRWCRRCDPASVAPRTRLVRCGGAWCERPCRCRLAPSMRLDAASLQTGKFASAERTQSGSGAGEPSIRLWRRRSRTTLAGSAARLTVLLRLAAAVGGRSFCGERTGGWAFASRSNSRVRPRDRMPGLRRLVGEPEAERCPVVPPPGASDTVP